MGQSLGRRPADLQTAELRLAVSGKLYQLKEIYNAAVTVLRESQVLPNLESWLATPRANDFAAMRRDNNIVIVSGPSRTAGIAMELAMGIHGLRELHIVLLP